MTSSAYLTLYSSILLLSLNGLFSNGLGMDVIPIIFLRSLFAALALLLFIRLIKKRKLSLPNRQSIFIVYGLGLLMGLHWLTFFYSMQQSSVAIGMLALHTYPLMTIMIEPIFNRKKISAVDLALGFLSFIGLAIMVAEQLSLNNKGIVLGVLSGILSAIFFTLRNLFQKYHCHNVSSDKLMVHQVMAICLLLLPFMGLGDIQSIQAEQWFWLVILGVFTTALCHTLFVASFKVFPAKTVSIVACLQPVIGGFFAWLLLNEEIHLSTILGGTIILSIAIYELAKQAENKT